ncbi:hypothetical protein B0T20DRAFT_231625 [Sordaria brevicollis]|uniref:Uncharacterized protein n=1 Tax=Sordaria brevicollis TaxID=83679 RepID=A0AAE0UBM8_SORBR|nr:hypothetical protein B0T20DRAFT_231625 [Sordaria brevicollis]
MPPITTVTRFVHAVTHQKREDSFDGDDTTSPGIGRKLLIIILSSAIPVGVLVLAGVVICLCWRKKQRRIRLFSRTVTPVDDEEIATWKTPKSEEAGFTTSGDNTDVDGKSRPTTGDRLNTSHGKQPSTSSVKSIKKPASVIVYTNPQDQAAAAGGEFRKSLDEGSPRSAAPSTHSGYYGKTSIDHTPALPPTPILARAPNSRAGLTDETVPGDVPFIPAPKRQPSRLYKLPPGVANGPSTPRSRHGRKRSSKSSTSSIGGYSFYNNNYNYNNRVTAAYYQSGGGYTSDSDGGGGGVRGRGRGGFPGRHSHDHARTRSMHHAHHTRLHSGLTVPPRLSLGDDALSSSRRQYLKEEEIGRAIG